MNDNNFQFKITPSLPENVILNETSGIISIDYRFIRYSYDYTNYTITMYNNEISYSYSMYLRVFYSTPTITNINDNIKIRSDRFYYPVEIEGIYTSFSLSDGSNCLKIDDDCVLSVYINQISYIRLYVYYYDNQVYENFRLIDSECYNDKLIIIVDIIDIETVYMKKEYTTIQ